MARSIWIGLLHIVFNDASFLHESVLLPSGITSIVVFVLLFWCAISFDGSFQSLKSTVQPR